MVMETTVGRKGCGQILLIGVTVAAAVSLSACSQRSTTSNPKAYCTAAKVDAAQFAALQDNLTQKGAKAYAASLRKLEGIAPKELESAVKTTADAWTHYVKTGDHSAMTGKGYAAAVDQINTWESEFCK